MEKIVHVEGLRESLPQDQYLMSVNTVLTVHFQSVSGRHCPVPLLSWDTDGPGTPTTTVVVVTPTPRQHQYLYSPYGPRNWTGDLTS